MFSKNAPIYFGLDIGDATLKLAAALNHRGMYELTNYGKIDLPPGCFEKGKIIKIEEAANKMADLINKTKGIKMKTRFVHACLPDNQTFIKLITIPMMPEDEIPQAVEWAAEHNLPFTLDEIYIDWQVIRKTPENKLLILLGAAPRETVDSYTQLIQDGGLIPLTMEAEALAIVRSLIRQKNNEPDDQGTAIIDLGATRSSLIIYGNGAVHSIFSLPISGNEITKSISQKLSITHEQAENAKIICGLDQTKCQGGLRLVLEDVVKQLIDKIKTSISFYQENEENSLPINHLLLSGGGAKLLGMDKLLEQTLKIPTTIGNPAQFLTAKNDIKIPEESLLGYTTAIGLAIKDF